MLLFATLSALATVAVAGVPMPRGVLIVGGSDTTIEKHPHQVSSTPPCKTATITEPQCYTATNAKSQCYTAAIIDPQCCTAVSLEKPYGVEPNGHWCGGSVVSPKFIVTGAVCVISTSSKPEIWTVRLGSTTSNKGGITMKLAAIQVYPDYNQGTFDGDVAVVTLKEAVTYSDKIQPIALVPINKEPEGGEPVVVTGWGRMSNGVMATILQEVEVPVVDREECQRTVYGSMIRKTMLCAGVVTKDSCHGDAGGPLINAKRELVGIVSWGFGCGKLGAPGVYASVANPLLHKFITSTVNGTEKVEQ